MTNQVEGVVSGLQEKRIFVDRKSFVDAWETSASAAEVAKKTGLKESSCLARASKYRSEGLPLKNMAKGGGAKLNPEDTLALIAEIRGVSIEEVRKQGAKLAAAAAERAAERASS